MPDLSKTSEHEATQITWFSRMCESGRYAPHVHSNEALTVQSPCQGRNKLNVVSCQDDSREEFVKEVGGLDMLEVELNNTPSHFREFIPIIPRGMFKCPGREIPSRTVGVVLNDILTVRLGYRHGYLYLPQHSEIDEGVLANPAFRDKRIVLFSTGPDILIESLWWRRHEKELFKKIARMEFCAVGGMNFSVFTGECPFAHALNIKKSLCYCRELERLGVPTIPHIYAVNNYQRERWQNWLQANPSVQIVTINTQLQGRDMRAMKQVYKTVQLLLESTHVDIIIHGSSKGLDYLIQTFPERLHRAASGPLKSASIIRDKSVAHHIKAYRNRFSMLFRNMDITRSNRTQNQQ